MEKVLPENKLKRIEYYSFLFLAISGTSFLSLRNLMQKNYISYINERARNPIKLIRGMK